MGEDHVGLFVGAAVVASSEQDDRWRELVRGGEEGAEVGVAGYHDTFLVDGETEEHFVVGCFESEVDGVDGVVPDLAEELGQSR